MGFRPIYNGDGMTSWKFVNWAKKCDKKSNRRLVRLCNSVLVVNPQINYFLKHSINPCQLDFLNLEHFLMHPSKSCMCHIFCKSRELVNPVNVCLLDHFLKILANPNSLSYDLQKCFFKIQRFRNWLLMFTFCKSEVFVNPEFKDLGILSSRLLVGFREWDLFIVSVTRSDGPQGRSS